MRPRRASRPTVPIPGATGCRSSSSTAIRSSMVNPVPARSFGRAGARPGHAGLGRSEAVDDGDVRQQLLRALAWSRPRPARRRSRCTSRLEASIRLPGVARRRERVEQRPHHRVADQGDDVGPLALDRASTPRRRRTSRPAAARPCRRRSSIWKAPQCALTCISGGVMSAARSRGRARGRTAPPGDVIGPSSVVGSPPPIVAKKMSSCRQTTPFGMPVVPPVQAM